MSSAAPPEVKAAAVEMFQTVVDENARREAIRTQALADAWETPMPSINRTNTTNNNFPVNPPAVATTPPARTNGVSSVVKSAAIGAALLGTGGLGALALPAISNWLNKPAAVAPAQPPGQVTIGINPDGTLYDPNALGTSK